ncbi:MAG: hypothetical protein ACYSTY_12235 [Planctomycetota bacterium]|jgi:hypothetical protein
MATAAVYYPHVIRVQTGGAAYSDITQLTDVIPANNYQDLVEFASGQTAPQFVGSEGTTPDINFTSRQLKTVLDLIDTESVAMKPKAYPVDVHYKKGDEGGTRVADATAQHLRARMAASTAMLYLMSISANQGASAELRARLLAIWDGTNNPVVWTGSLALAATSAATHTYTLGRVDLNGTDLAAVQSVDLQWNVTPEEVADSGEAFITYGGVAQFSPTLVITTRDTNAMVTYGATAGGVTLTALECYFRKRDDNLINVADGTAEHIKITATSGLIKGRQASGLNGSTEIFVQLTKPNATTAPLIINTASAIT